MLLEHPALIVIIPLICALITPIIGMWKKYLCYLWAIFALFLSTIVSIDTLIAVIRNGTIHYKLGGWAAPYGIEYLIDHLNAMMLVLITGISLVVAVYSYQTVERELPKKLDYF